jgi:hypothetical protein
MKHALAALALTFSITAAAATDVPKQLKLTPQMQAVFDKAELTRTWSLRHDFCTKAGLYVSASTGIFAGKMNGPDWRQAKAEIDVIEPQVRALLKAYGDTDSDSYLGIFKVMEQYKALVGETALSVSKKLGRKLTLRTAGMGRQGFPEKSPCQQI